MKKQSTLAVVIVGAVTSGKTTLAKKIAAACSLELITEETTGNYFQICTEMNPRLHPRAIFDHCWIGSETNRLLHIYDRVILVALEVSEPQLRHNYRQRVKEGSGGDFSKIDPHHQQRGIIERVQIDQRDLFVNHPHSTSSILSIKSPADYDKAEQTVVQLVG